MRLILVAVASLLAATLAAPPAAAHNVDPICVVVVDQPDFGLTYCVHRTGDCLVSRTRTTIFGTETDCVVERP